MGSRMVYNIRAVRLKHRLNPVGIPDRTDENCQVQIRERPLQLLLQIIGIILINVEDNQLPGLVTCNLAAQLASDGSASSGYKDDLVLYISCLLYTSPSASPHRAFRLDEVR